MRSRLRRAALAAPLALLAGCGGIGLAPMATPLEAVEVGPVGPVLPQPDGRAPIECRGVPRDRCVGPGSDPTLPAAERVIVSCIGICTPLRGEFRIDLLNAGQTELAGQGGWGQGP